MFAALAQVCGFRRAPTRSAARAVRHEPQQKQMRSLVNSLTEDQRQRVLAYEGPVASGQSDLPKIRRERG